MSKIKNQLLPLILSVLILSFLTAYWIFAWDEPGSSPPTGNVATPINTGSTAQTKSGALTVTKLTADSASNDKIMLQGTQTAPHTIWLGDSKGVRFWDSINGELMLISNTGDVSISELINCDTIDTDASGKMVCGVDDTGAGSEDTLDTVADRGNTTDQAITIGGDLTISKSGTDSDIIFPAQTNDPGYIRHYENSNVGVMYFSASDDRTTGDYFSFGSTPNDSYDEGARLTTAGKLQIDGDLTVSGGNVYIGIDGELYDGGTNLLRTPDSLVVDGKVGVGTASPRTDTLLDVAGAVGVGRQGIGGTYDSTQVQGVWSIAPNYKISTGSNDFGTQYGITYAHHNAGTSGGKKPIADWGHQILFTSSGNRNAVISLSSGHAYFAGNVGIGTTGPKNKLDVEGGAVIGGIYSGTNTAPSDGLLVQGYVGIGTTSPAYRLDVSGNVGLSEYIFHNGDSNTYLRFLTDRIIGVAGVEQLLDLYEGSQDYVKLGDNGDVDINLNNNVFVRGSDGNVGIGTTSPGTNLEVNGEIMAGRNYTKAKVGIIKIYKTSTSDESIYNIFIHPAYSGLRLTWQDKGDYGRLGVQFVGICGSAYTHRISTYNDHDFRIMCYTGNSIRSYSGGASFQVTAIGEGDYGFSFDGYTVDDNIFGVVTYWY